MNLDDIINNSYRNFHVKGFDYLCLKRTPGHTRKVYFFEGDVSQLPEVVNPHDHRYDFTTRVINGSVMNKVFMESWEAGDVYYEHEWRTPLNGGDGFSFKKETRLECVSSWIYDQRSASGHAYHSKANELHTIRIMTSDTILVLDQYRDVMPIDQPSRTFLQDKQAPNLDGLYEQFTPDQVLARIGQLMQLGVLSFNFEIEK